MDRTLQQQLLRGLWVALWALAAVAALYYLTPLVAPFLFGWLIAYILNPLVHFLQKRTRAPRWLAVTVSLLLFLGISVGLITIAVTNIVLEINDLSALIQSNMEKWKTSFTAFVNSDHIQHLITRITTYYNENPQYQDTINSNLNSTGKTVTDFVSRAVSFVVNNVLYLAASLPNMATVTVVALLAAFLISFDWNRLNRKLGEWTPGFVARPVRLIWIDLQKALFGYMRAQLILISITAMFVIIGLLILRVEYAITIGLLIGFVDLLPYLGTGAAMVPWIIFCFIQDNYYLGIGLSILYGIILVARQILEPKILATSIGLEALPTLIAMYVGLKLFGFLGLIIGPVTLILLTTFQRSGVFRDLWRYIRHGKASDA
ncbi:sporulation integral membrane protein YtvI [Gorillibacterium sp. sgz5001074]|uniref:sporulation integral membrane protein YtvI n=1 Tax=Gorillibacterium sp. sgz5001074 TaxID=3446695 RepID=UPI003F6753F4